MVSDDAEDFFESSGRGVAQGGVRVANERAVLTMIAIHPGASNAELARLSGLGPQTTLRIVAELEARGLVRRGAVRRGRRGQPATPISVEPQAIFSIGIEIGWDHLSVHMLDLAGGVHAEERHAFAYARADDAIALAAAIVARLTGALPAELRTRPILLGIATPSTLHRDLSAIGAPAEEMARWAGLDIVAAFRRETGIEPHRFNDGNAACWGELVAHPMPRPRRFAYLHIGRFVAAGVIGHGGLWETPSGHAADLGAMIVAGRDGAAQRLHDVASLTALMGLAERAGEAPPSGDPAGWDWDGLEPVVADWIAQSGRGLAQAIVSTQAATDLDLAIIDGTLPRPVLERVIGAVRTELAGLPAPAPGRATVSAGHLGAQAGATGAAFLALFRSYFARDWPLPAGD